MNQRLKMRLRCLLHGDTRNAEARLNVTDYSCLKNLKFILTGMLQSLEHNEVKQLIENYGGTVERRLTAKIDYLIVGDLMDEQIISEAKVKKIKIVNEHDFCELFM